LLRSLRAGVGPVAGVLTFVLLKDGGPRRSLRCAL